MEVEHVWVDDLGYYHIPAALYEATKFRADGWPDQRCKVRNTPFMAWLEEQHAQSHSDFLRSLNRYTITDKGRELLDLGPQC